MAGSEEKRTEKIFRCDLSKKSFLNSVFFEKEHTNTFITTVYFGATSELWDGIRSLSAMKCGIRLRYYQRKSKNDIFIVDAEEKCNLEFKTHKDATRSNNKIYIRGDDGMCLREAMKYLHTLLQGKNDVYYTKYEVMTNRLKTLIEEYKIKDIVPIGAVNYERYRFADNDVRQTFDFDVRYYLSCTKDTDLIMRYVGENGYTVAEVKGNIADDDCTLENGLFEILGCEYEQITRTKAKGVKEYFETIAFDFIEPELLEKSKYDWEITEREIKLDADRNPKLVVEDVIRKMQADGYILGACRPNVNYQYAFDVGGSGLIYMDKDGNGKNAVLKYKDYISHDEKDGTLVRYEYVEPYNDDNLKRILARFGCSVGKIKKSPYFKRDRILTNFINPNNGNVFELYADHSYFLDGSKKNDFYQVEIEFAGIIKGSNEILDKDKMLKNIIMDFEQLSIIVPKYYKKCGCNLVASTRTKYEWVKKECF